MAEELGESGEVLILVDNSKAKADTVREVLSGTRSRISIRALR